MKEGQDTPKKLRLFVGFGLPESVHLETLRIQKHFQQKEVFIGRWTKPVNLHLTLKFLGEVEADSVPQIMDALKSVEFQSFHAVVGELGAFSSKGTIRILWIHLLGEGVLNLQNKVDDALSENFEPETRFMSHLTIARIKSVTHKRRFLNEINDFKTKPIEFLVEEFALIQSSLTPSGPIYAPICSYSNY